MEMKIIIHVISNILRSLSNTKKRRESNTNLKHLGSPDFISIIKSRKLSSAEQEQNKGIRKQKKRRNLSRKLLC